MRKPLSRIYTIFIQHTMCTIWTFIILISIGLHHSVSAHEHRTMENAPLIHQGRELIAPKIDYNEWKPIGRGDPLNKDPTFDYSPPVLDHVKYWNDSPKKDRNDILLLGVPSIKRQLHTQNNIRKSLPMIERRNYYPMPPTKLMPPPMHQPNYSSSSEMYQEYNRQHQSNQNQHDNQYYKPMQHSKPQAWVSSSVDTIPNASNTISNIIPHSSVMRPQYEGNRYQMKPNDPDMPSLNSPAMKPWLHALLEKELVTPQGSSSVVSVQFAPSINEIHSSNMDLQITPVMPSFFEPTTVRYETEMEPLAPALRPLPTVASKPPMFFIIEGHSKVKTYTSQDNDTAKVHEPKIIPIGGKDDPVIHHMVLADDKTNIPLEVKHLHTHPTTTKKPKKSSTKNSGVMSNLLSLLDSSFDKILSDDLPAKNATVEKPLVDNNSTINNEIINEQIKLEVNNDVKQTNKQNVTTTDHT